MTKEFFNKHKIQNEQIAEIANKITAINEKMEELLYKYNVSRETILNNNNNNKQ